MIWSIHGLLSYMVNGELYQLGGVGRQLTSKLQTLMIDCGIVRHVSGKGQLLCKRLLALQKSVRCVTYLGMQWRMSQFKSKQCKL